MDPQIIKTSEDYRRAFKEAESLIALDPDPGTDEAERLDILSLLIEKYESEQFPIELPDPLEAIKFRMDQQGLRQRDLIPFIGSKSKVSEVLAGKRSLTVPMIRALHEGLGIPAEVLLQEPQPEDEHQEEVDWEKFPLKEMAKRGWLKATPRELRGDAKELVVRFFEPLGGMECVPVFCRKTLVERSGKAMDKYVLWAWTARVLTRAKFMELSSYTAGTVDQEFMEQVAHLSLSEKGPIKAQKYLADHGIALILEPHLPRTHLDGAAMLSSDRRPIIGLTIRHDRIDNFWFNLMHELVHIWKHLKSPDEAFVDDLDSAPGKDPREREADRIAGEILIPRRIWKRSDAYRQRTPDAIQELALRLRIHPAIIAGRIRHDAKNYYILSQMVGKGKVRKLFPDIEWQKGVRNVWL
jgi:HTH-type transcriptional regulator/antitoxin HigA